MWDWGLAVQVVAIGVSAIWVVASIWFTTGKLSTAIEHLSKSIDSLNAKLDAVDDKVDQHGERLAALEARKE